MIPSVNIVIPTFNRAHLIRASVEAALGQSHPHCIVTVVDDASQDRTREILSDFRTNPRFNYIRLSQNGGTAQAKNVGILFSPSDAITFHDSDDVPHRDKVIRQARVIGNEEIGAHPVLNWKLASRVPGSKIQVGAVLTHHELILPNGERVEIRRTLSLVDDVFPNLQMAAGVPGDWTHVNSGLFHSSVFRKLGGFSDCIEEDREFRNRLILSGEIIWVIPEVLLTKIETPDSLTQSSDTDYDSERRQRDRQRVWKMVEDWFHTREVPAAPLDLADLRIAEIWNRDLITVSDVLKTPATGDLALAEVRSQRGVVPSVA
ncbi:glycosyltransferase [Silicimonas algicola]|uniref:Glycosyl transferase family 2 n=1 Tax=Silicimonas algicola TaxID=1826607 RepID=A0A316GE13_9RHOB|nr:glycosyltransferase family 2 protein [Silicimonas algicola]AZQ66475.1 glycosyltransferase [Silicimonas algicola]PWK58813.1 glycosyl transferase family 2 [Silicimonas algicola]